MSQTSAQKIAELEDRIARLKAKDRALENGQKIILGGMLINAARTDERIRKWMLEAAKRSVTREVDQTRIEPILVELRALPTS